MFTPSDSELEDGVGKAKAVVELLKDARTEIEDLREAVADRDKQIESLKSEVSDLEDQIAEAQEETRKATEQADRWALEVLHVRGTVPEGDADDQG